MELNKKRWLVIAAGVTANLCQGAAYTFSVFKAPLKAHLGCGETQVALAFSLSIAFVPVGVLLSGKASDSRSPRLVIFLGGLLFGSGMFLAGFSNSLTWLYLTYGVMLSLGNGAAYGAVIATAVRWFPERRGMASGIVVSSLGIGALIIAPIAQRMIEMPSLGVLGTFKMLGIAYFVIMAIASWFIVNPPKGYADAQANNGIDEENYTWPRMLVRPRFWALYVTYTAGTFSGLMVISQAASIAQEITHLGAVAAALVVSVLGLANALGRLFWGAISDRIGRIQALSMMFAVTSIAMFLLADLAKESAGLIVATALVGLCYGGYLGTFPSICADSFGSKNLTVNYGVLLTSYGIAALIGPRVGASLREITGGYDKAFMTAGTIAACGLALTLVIRLSDRRCRSRK